MFRPAKPIADLGFIGRTLLTLCSLPRTNPGDRHQYKRVNGPYTLIMTATGNYKLPFGNLPRLLMAWLSTEAVRTQSRVISLGDSLAEFMRTLGIYNSGGNPQTRLRNQMDRLFNASIRLTYEDERGAASVSSLVADRTEFWWDERKPDEYSLWDSKIELGEKLFNEIIQHPVPLDMNILAALKRSRPGPRFLPLAQLPHLRASRSAVALLAVALPPVRNGTDRASDKRTVDAFRTDSLRELKKIKLAWPDLHYATAKGVLILYPSKPAIAPTTGPQRLAE